jgi:hypothetical protein
MQNFVMQLWNDLRARRLVPVAVLLVAGLVAAPVVLSKKADETPAPAPAPAPAQANKQAGPQALAKVKLEDTIGKGNGSSLSAFDVNNPFAPPAKVLKAAKDEAQNAAGTSPTDTGTGGATPTDTGTGTGTPTGGGTGGGTDNGTGGGGGGTTTTQYTYVLDVTFWANGHKRTIKGLQKLDILPNEASPLLIFMGVSDGAGNGVFLVDSTLQTTGEGKCKPSHADCAFLYLGAGSEQEFTNDAGDSYRLRIDEIRKVKLGDASSATSSKSKSGKSARAAVGETAPARRFSLPALTDLVVESAQGTDNSTGADQRR